MLVTSISSLEKEFISFFNINVINGKYLQLSLETKKLIKIVVQNI